MLKRPVISQMRRGCGLTRVWRTQSMLTLLLCSDAIAPGPVGMGRAATNGRMDTRRSGGVCSLLHRWCKVRGCHCWTKFQRFVYSCSLEAYHVRLLPDLRCSPSRRRQRRIKHDTLARCAFARHATLVRHVSGRINTFGSHLRLVLLFRRGAVMVAGYGRAVQAAVATACKLA